MRTLVLLDLANIGKTLRDKEMRFDPKETLDRIREEHEIVAVWGFSDMVKQLSYRNNQLELQDLGVWLFHTPKENPWDKPDDEMLISTVRWMLNICPDSFDSIHLGSGDGDFNEVMWQAYSGSGKTIFVDSSGLLPVSAGITCYATSSDFLRAKPKNQRAVVTSDDMIRAIESRLRSFREYVETDVHSASRPFDVAIMGMYKIFEGEDYLVDSLLSAAMSLIIEKDELGQLCSFGYVTSVLRDRIREIECFRQASFDSFEAEIDISNAEDWAKVLLSEAIDAGLIWKQVIDTREGERTTCKPNITRYKSHFETPEEVIAEIYGELSYD